MKKFGQLMQEMGFNKSAPDSVKEAFIKHLVYASEGVRVATPTEKKEIVENPQTVIELPTPQQLSFSFEENADNEQKKAL